MQEIAILEINKRLQEKGIAIKDDEFLRWNGKILERFKINKFELRAYKFPYACWSCKKQYDIILPFLFINEGVEGLADTEFLGEFAKDFPTVKLRHSYTTYSEYYANVCPSCNKILGDFYLKDISIKYVYDLDKHTPAKIIEIKPDSELYRESVGMYARDCSLCLLCGNPTIYNMKKLSKEQIDFHFILCEDCYSKIYEKPDAKECGICKKRLEGKAPALSSKTVHHTCYFPPTTMAICRGCHLVLHSNKPTLNEFSPDTEYVKWQKHIPNCEMIPCKEKCGHKARVPISEYDAKKEYTCTSCQNKQRASLYVKVPCANKCGRDIKMLKAGYRKNKEYICNTCKRINAKKQGIFWENWRRKHGRY